MKRMRDHITIFQFGVNLDSLAIDHYLTRFDGTFLQMGFTNQRLESRTAKSNSPYGKREHDERGKIMIKQT
jgi:hypothetical protein